MGGEKVGKLDPLPFTAGSPPRGRGKGTACRVEFFGEGITPAWAGKRQNVRWKLSAIKDHPRVGGEKRQCNDPC